jgi:hypothetical protein
MNEKKINELNEQKYLFQYISDYYVQKIEENKEMQKYELLGKKVLIKDINNLKIQISSNYFEYAEYFDFIKVENYNDWYNCSENFINTILDDYLLSPIQKYKTLSNLFEMFHSELVTSKKKGLNHIVIDHEQYFEIEEKFNFLIVLNDITKFVFDTMKLKLLQLILKLEFNKQYVQDPNNKQAQLKENELSEKIKKHFGFLLDKGRKNAPMMAIDEFNDFVIILEDYYNNNFSLTVNHTQITTKNVTKNTLLKAIKTFYMSFEHPEKSKNMPDSLVELANKVTQDNWQKVDITNIQKA